MPRLTAAPADTPLRLGHTPLALAWAPALQSAAREAGALGVVSSAWEDDLLADLRTGRHAAIIGHAIPAAPDLRTHRLATDPLHAVADGLDPAAGEIHLLDLAGRELLLGPAELQPSWQAFVIAAVTDHIGDAPRVRTVATSAPAAQHADPPKPDPGAFALLPASCLAPGTPALPVVPAITAPVTLAWLAASIRPDLQRTISILLPRSAPGSARGAGATRRSCP